MLFVEDMSHPDRIAQKETVLETLRRLNIRPEVMDSIIFVGNKVDKLLSLPHDPSIIYISCLSGFGFSQLVADIDKVGSG